MVARRHTCLSGPASQPSCRTQLHLSFRPPFRWSAPPDPLLPRPPLQPPPLLLSRPEERSMLGRHGSALAGVLNHAKVCRYGQALGFYHDSDVRIELFHHSTPRPVRPEVCMLVPCRQKRGSGKKILRPLVKNKKISARTFKMKISARTHRS